MKSTAFVFLSILCMAAVPLICQASDDSFWKGDQALHEISECDA